MNIRCLSKRSLNNSGDKLKDKVDLILRFKRKDRIQICRKDARDRC